MLSEMDNHDTNIIIGWVVGNRTLHMKYEIGLDSTEIWLERTYYWVCKFPASEAQIYSAFATTTQSEIDGKTPESAHKDLFTFPHKDCFYAETICSHSHDGNEAVKRHVNAIWRPWKLLMSARANYSKVLT